MNYRKANILAATTVIVLGLCFDMKAQAVNVNADVSKDVIVCYEGDVDSGIRKKMVSAEEYNEYKDFAIANVSDFVNVRSGPSTDSEIVGKIYDGAVAHVIETTGENGEWFKMVSGDVEGYIKSEYFIYGMEAVRKIDEYVTEYAIIKADVLNVRREPGTDKERIGYVRNGEKIKILGNAGDWIKVQYTADQSGYIAAEYVTLAEEFIYAKTLEQEAEELAVQRLLTERQSEATGSVTENVSISTVPKNGDYETTSELRKAIVDYSMQFLGNKYVSGGQSLVSGTDCSGFTSMIYAEFGYSLSRIPAGQYSGDGRGIGYDEIQPGDIVCYGSQSCSHVALYIGNGLIIHSANSRRGVVTDSVDCMNILGIRNVID